MTRVGIHINLDFYLDENKVQQSSEYYRKVDGVSKEFKNMIHNLDKLVPGIKVGKFTVLTESLPESEEAERGSGSSSALP